MAGGWIPPQEWVGRPSAIGFDRQCNYNVGNGGSFMEFKLIETLGPLVRTAPSYRLELFYEMTT